MQIARVNSDDCVMDIGCGDGRLLVHAAQRCKCRCVGIDIRQSCLEDTRLSAERGGVSDLVEAILFDMMEDPDAFVRHTWWTNTTVVYAYLLPDVTQRMQPIFRRAVDEGKMVILYCSSGSRVRRPNAPPAGNVIGDLVPAAQAMMGRVRLYCKSDVLARRLSESDGVGRVRSVEEPYSIPSKMPPRLPGIAVAREPQALRPQPLALLGPGNGGATPARIPHPAPTAIISGLGTPRVPLLLPAGLRSGHIQSRIEAARLSKSPSQLRLEAANAMLADAMARAEARAEADGTLHEIARPSTTRAARRAARRAAELLPVPAPLAQSLPQLHRHALPLRTHVLPPLPLVC